VGQELLGCIFCISADFKIDLHIINGGYFIN
jgi:hypothetical protein